MDTRLWPKLAGVLAAVLLTAALALLEWLGTPLPPAWLVLLAATGLTAGAGLIGLWFVQRRYRLILKDLAARITALQTNPSQQLVQGKGDQAPLDADAQLVQNRLGALVACYRDALVEVVRIQELVDKLHADDANRGAADDSLGPMRYLGSGTRRHDRAADSQSPLDCRHHAVATIHRPQHLRPGGALLSGCGPSGRCGGITGDAPGSPERRRRS